MRGQPNINISSSPTTGAGFNPALGFFLGFGVGSFSDSAVLLLVFPLAVDVAVSLRNAAVFAAF